MKKIIMLAVLFSTTPSLARQGCFETLQKNYEAMKPKIEKINANDRQRSSVGKVIRKLITPKNIVRSVVPVSGLALTAVDKTMRQILGNDNKIDSMATLIVSHQILKNNLELDSPEDAEMLKRFFQVKANFEDANNIKEPLSKHDFSKLITTLDSTIAGEENPFCKEKNGEIKITGISGRDFKKSEISKFFDNYKATPEKEIIANLNKLNYSGKSEAESFLQKCKEVLPVTAFSDIKFPEGPSEPAYIEPVKVIDQ